jgi:hypothetical protein
VGSGVYTSGVHTASFIGVSVLLLLFALLLNIVGVTTGCQPTYIKYYLLTVGCIERSPMGCQVRLTRIDFMLSQDLIQLLIGLVLFLNQILISHFDHGILPAVLMVPSGNSETAAGIQEVMDINIVWL